MRNLKTKTETKNQERARLLRLLEANRKEVNELNNSNRQIVKRLFELNK